MLLDETADCGNRFLDVFFGGRAELFVAFFDHRVLGVLRPIIGDAQQRVGNCPGIAIEVIGQRAAAGLLVLYSATYDQPSRFVDQLRNIGIAATDAVIIQTIIGMARNLGLEVIAEGVETSAQRAFLAEHGCHLCQGFLFARPLPLGEFESLLASTQRATAQ